MSGRDKKDGPWIDAVRPEAHLGELDGVLVARLYGARDEILCRFSIGIVGGPVNFAPDGCIQCCRGLPGVAQCNPADFWQEAGGHEIDGPGPRHPVDKGDDASPGRSIRQVNAHECLEKIDGKRRDVVGRLREIDHSLEGRKPVEPPDLLVDEALHQARLVGQGRDLMDHGKRTANMPPWAPGTPAAIDIVRPSTPRPGQAP